MKKILMDAMYPQETRVVLLNGNQIEAFEYETSNKAQIKNNIYLAKIVRIEPSLQAAFIEYTNGKNGFLPFAEIHPIYYHIPASDRNVMSAELQSITRPEITQKDIQESEQNILKDDEESILSLEADDIALEETHENSEPKERFENKYNIQDVIKKGQIVLVQAQKESRGNKGASFTTYISLAGKYSVLMPNTGNSNGISRKIASSEERRRLKAITDDLIAPEDRDQISIIIRTAGAKKSPYDIKKDFDYLVRLWNKIREITLQSSAPSFIHMEDDIIKKTIRDMCDHQVKEVIVQGDYAFAAASEIMHNICPTDSNKIIAYNKSEPLFTHYKIEEQLMLMYQPIVQLSSGGYIVINPTEALISIDVNSGKATSEKTIEETAVKTNIEAAQEIARQLKLRDLSGLIVIDFIDMYDANNKKLVEKVLRDSFAKDKARIQLGNISNFGLFEMSRQRIRSSFLETNTNICSHCNGKGIVRAPESNAMLMLRTIEQEIFGLGVDEVNVYGHITPIMYLLNEKRSEIKILEDKHKAKINFHNDHEVTSDGFFIEKIYHEDEDIAELKPLSSKSLIKESTEDTADDKPVVKSAKNPNKNWKARPKAEDKQDAEIVASASSNQTQSDSISTDENSAKKIFKKNNKKPRQKTSVESLHKDVNTTEAPKEITPELEVPASELDENKPTKRRRSKKIK